MRERAESIGAQLSVSSHPGQGTEVTLKRSDAEDGMPEERWSPAETGQQEHVR
jgi:hypothetical protein